MFYQLNIKKFILVFAICTVIFTPLIIEARNHALDLPTPTNAALDVAVNQQASPSETLSDQGAFAGRENRSPVRRFEIVKELPLMGHPGLRPKIGNR